MSLIDNVFNTVAKEVNKVQTRSQELMQGLNLQNQINEIERRKNAKLLELGKLVFDHHHNNKPCSDEVIKERCAEVAAFDHEMAILQTELDQIKVKNNPDATPSQKAEAKAGYSASPNFFCPGCGSPASRDKAFCPSCGEKLTDNKRPEASDGTETVDVEPTDGSGS